MLQSAPITALIVALFAGAALPLQAGANGYLGRLLGHPLAATLISLTVSLISLVALMLILRVPPPSGIALGRAPLWTWVGGLLGVLYLTVALMTAPKLGAATFIAATVAGQMAASMLLDHFALAGFPDRPVTLWRGLGLLLVVTGVAVFQFVGSQPGAR